MFAFLVKKYRQFVAHVDPKKRLTAIIETHLNSFETEMSFSSFICPSWIISSLMKPSAMTAGPMAMYYSWTDHFRKEIFLCHLHSPCMDKSSFVFRIVLTNNIFSSLVLHTSGYRPLGVPRAKGYPKSQNLGGSQVFSRYRNKSQRQNFVVGVAFTIPCYISEYLTRSRSSDMANFEVIDFLRFYTVPGQEGMWDVFTDSLNFVYFSQDEFLTL